MQRKGKRSLQDFPDKAVITALNSSIGMDKSQGLPLLCKLLIQFAQPFGACYVDSFNGFQIKRNVIA